jgi:predicted ribosome quality control (RQC) complex YloA/Tae2 family protein
MMKNYRNFITESKNSKLVKKIEIDGFEVLIGKNSEGNDYLTTELSNSNDWWFHAKGIPGSHVVIIVKDNEPSLEIIKKVAIIAAINSKCTTQFCDVIYCKRKYVVKKKEHKSGTVEVDYKNAKTINVKIKI